MILLHALFVRNAPYKFRTVLGHLLKSRELCAINFESQLHLPSVHHHSNHLPSDRYLSATACHFLELAGCNEPEADLDQPDLLFQHLVTNRLLIAIGGANL
jgi:hypothetical protein